MKRNSLFTKLFAMLLCVVMVVSCLPLSAFAEDWESEFDEADPIPGSAEAPIDLTADLLNEGDFSATVTVPAGETYYYLAYRLGGMLMSINYGEAVECTTMGMMYPYEWTITNDGTEDAEYVIEVSYPEGDMNNPQDLSAGESVTVTLEAGTQGWYFDFMAYENGYVTFEISGDSWMWNVTNTTTSVASDTYYSVVAEGEELKNTLTYQYTAEEEYVIMANTYNAEDPYTAPAGEITVTATFVSGWGTEESPYLLTEMENYPTIAAGETVYYYGYFSGMNMTVSGNENFVVTYNDTEYADFWGSIDPIAVSSDNPRMPIYFSVTNNNAEEAGYYIAFTYPEGTMNNPQDLWEGSNEHTFAEGDGAWYYDYIGYSDGYLTFKISADCGWQYVINNNTAGTYGDRQFSDSDPVVSEQTFTYYAGEEYVMEVVTYNPADMWATPAGTIDVEITFVPGFGTEESPYILNDLVSDVNIEGDDAVYYQGYFAGMNVAVEGEGDFSIIYQGETYTAVDGKVELSVPASVGMPMPTVIGIEGAGDYTITATYPAGHSENPAAAVLGDNVCSVNANSQGYYWTYTAEKDGELVVTISSSDNNWFYVVNNMTQYTYGDWLYSNDETAPNPTTISVEAGDVIQIQVNSFDPNSWDTPAATLTVNLAYEASYSVVFGSTIRNSANFVGAVELNQYSDITFSDNLTQEYILNNGGLLAFDGEVTEENATLENCEKVTYGLKLSNGLYGGTTAGIPAAEYGKELTLRLFVKLPNGEVVYGGLKSYSVKQYCEGRITSASSAQTMKNLAAATLHYGAMAQYNFNKDTGNLANANLPAEYAQSAFAYDASYIDALNTDATFALAGTGNFAAPRRTLNFVGAVEIVHQFQPSGIENMQKIEMLVWKNMSGELNEADADVIAMEDAGDGWYKANTAGIPAAEYGYTFILCAKVTDAEGNTYYSDLSFYSPETYAANQIAKTTTSENTKNVCMAMVVFGQMAKIHFGK